MVSGLPETHAQWAFWRYLQQVGSKIKLLSDEINEYFANRNKLLTFANYCASLWGSGAT